MTPWPAETHNPGANPHLIDIPDAKLIGNAAPAVLPAVTIAFIYRRRWNSDTVGWLSIVHLRAVLQPIGIGHIVKVGLCACMRVYCAAWRVVATTARSYHRVGVSERLTDAEECRSWSSHRA